MKKGSELSAWKLMEATHAASRAATPALEALAAQFPHLSISGTVTLDGLIAISVFRRHGYMYDHGLIEDGLSYTDPELIARLTTYNAEVATSRLEGFRWCTGHRKAELLSEGDPAVPDGAEYACDEYKREFIRARIEKEGPLCFAQGGLQVADYRKPPSITQHLARLAAERKEEAAS